MATARPGARRFDAADGHDSPAEEIARLKERAEELERQLAAFGQSRAASDYHAHLDEMAIAINGWFWETDNRLRFTYLSPNVENISGVSAEWHYGKSRYEMGIPGSVSREDWELHLGQLERREPFSDFIYQRQGPNGVKWLKVSGGPYYGLTTFISKEIVRKSNINCGPLGQTISPPYFQPYFQIGPTLM